MTDGITETIHLEADVDAVAESINGLCEDVKDLNAELEYTIDLLEAVSENHI